MTSRFVALVVTTVAALAVSPAFGQERSGYAELAATWSTFSLDNGQFQRSALTVTSTSESREGFVLRLGYDLGARWSLEGAYADSGYITVRGFDGTGTAWSTHIHVTNWTLGGVFRHALNDKLEVFARLSGLAYVNEFGKSAAVQRVLYDQERGVGISYGAGLAWKLTDRFSLRGAVDRYAGNQESTALSLGLKVAF